MRIDKLQSDLIRSDASRDVRDASEVEAVKQAASPSEAPRGDSVQISAAGRALAEGADGDNLSPERLQELRELVVGGKYDRPEVIAEVARRMTASGDLQADLGE